MTFLLEDVEPKAMVWACVSACWRRSSPAAPHCEAETGFSARRLAPAVSLAAGIHHSASGLLQF